MYERREPTIRDALLVTRLWYCYTFCGRQLSRTKWPFAVSSLARGPGDGARVRSSLAQADDENAILRSGRWPLGTFSVSPHFSARYVFQWLFEIFAHVYTRQITRAKNEFHALSLRWRGNAICLSTDDGSVRDTLPRSTLRFDSCSINRQLRGDFVFTLFRFVLREINSLILP